MKSLVFLCALTLSPLLMVSCQEQVEILDITEPVSDAGESAKTAYTWPPSSEEQVADVLKENYMVVMDDSGSMSGRRINEARQALLTLSETLPAEHNLGVVFLNDPSVVPLSSGSRAAFQLGVKRVNAYGGTPLSAATVKAFRAITEQASKQGGYGAYHLIIVTDGNSTDGSPLSLVRSIVENSSVQVHVIGFHLRDHVLNDPAFIDYQTASNSTELARAFESVTAETDEFTDPTEFSQ